MPARVGERPATVGLVGRFQLDATSERLVRSSGLNTMARSRRRGR